MRLSVLGLFPLACALAQAPVVIRVDAATRLGPLPPIFSYFGYDEPNYTYTPNGVKLIGELAALSPVPVYIRTHHLLCAGDGTAALKWGSTNAYTEDAAGKPVYDWTIVDRIFDAITQAHARPFVEIGFMPEALSTHPEPYTRHWPTPDDGIGWSYPPKDYDKWAELIRQWVLHSIARYGKAEVETWYWEVWNEPDISYWRGTAEEYDKLYDYAVRAVKRALPTARVGGPATTGPSGAKAGAYLEQFLAHCQARRSPLDFITYHAKGAPVAADGHVRMGIQHELADVDRGLEIVRRFPSFRGLPIILSEADPEGCAACSARDHPNNAYRNGTLYPVYTAVALDSMMKLAQRRQANLAGMLTWAFEFEGRQFFEGFRTLATNGIDKPVLNAFRMFGLMGSERVKVESKGAVALDSIVGSGVRGPADIDAMASRGPRSASVLVWNYHDDDLPAPAADIEMSVSGLPSEATRVELLHYRIDEDHSNAYAAWKRMGSPQALGPEAYAHLEAAGRLELLDSPNWLRSAGGRVTVRFSLPRQALSLVQLSW